MTTCRAGPRRADRRGGGDRRRRAAAIGPAACRLSSVRLAAAQPPQRRRACPPTVLRVRIVERKLGDADDGERHRRQRLRVAGAGAAQPSIDPRRDVRGRAARFRLTTTAGAPSRLGADRAPRGSSTSGGRADPRRRTRHLRPRVVRSSRASRHRCDRRRLRMRSWSTASTSGSAADRRPAAGRVLDRGPANGGASVASTRTSNPARSSRSRNDRTSPRESSSMSKSSAPTAATPRTPSAGARRLADELSQPARDGTQRSGHRRDRARASCRRSSVQDATRLRATPSGTASSDRLQRRRPA